MHIILYGTTGTLLMGDFDRYAHVVRSYTLVVVGGMTSYSSAKFFPQDMLRVELLSTIVGLAVGTSTFCPIKFIRQTTVLCCVLCVVISSLVDASIHFPVSVGASARITHREGQHDLFICLFHIRAGPA